MRVVVVGAGFGGLAAAIRLGSAGHDVLVLERNPVVGGKVATLALDGYRFDLGPAVLTLPGAYDELLRAAGTSLADAVELIALDPQARYRWTDGSTLDVPDDETAWRAELERFSPGASLAWQQFAARAEEIWHALDADFLTGPPRSGLPVVRRLRPALDLAAVDAKRTLTKAADAYFDDPRLRQIAKRLAQLPASSPNRAPATFAYLAHLERTYGCWYVRGGLGALRDALERAATTVGVQIRCGVDVGRVSAGNGRVTGVELADGGHEPADIVVANVDAGHLYTELLPHPARARALDQAKRSMSGFLVCAGVRGRTEGIVHQNVWFALDGRAEHQWLDAGQVPIDPTITACVSSVTDPSAAPNGCENWYLLVTTPAAIGIDRKLMTAAVLNRLAERGFDLRPRIEFTRTLVPADFDVRYRAVGGAFHGTSSDSADATFQRPSNVGPVDGLYLVGGSTHPGGGLPMVAISARIVADLIADRDG